MQSWCWLRCPIWANWIWGIFFYKNKCDIINKEQFKFVCLFVLYRNPNRSTEIWHRSSPRGGRFLFFVPVPPTQWLWGKRGSGVLYKLQGTPQFSGSGSPFQTPNLDHKSRSGSTWPPMCFLAYGPSFSRTVY